MEYNPKNTDHLIEDIESPSGKLNKEDDIKKQLVQDLEPQSFGLAGKLWVTLLLIICGVGLIAYFKQLNEGLIITDMRDYSSWGIYISNFVFFVAISLVGSLISAILKLTDTRWRIPLTRIAEIIAVSFIAFAGIVIIVDMGRPERMLNLFIYGRIQSPIIWDVLVVTTYLVISLLLLYIPLIPDLFLCRKYSVKNSLYKNKFFDCLMLKWKDSEGQYKIVNKSIKILAVLIIPVALGIHTVTSWLFATTFRSGWDSTNFGPYFVSGAFMLGAAAVIAAMFVLRRQYKLEKYITLLHFNNMGKLLVLLSLLYLYFNINEYLVPAYKMKLSEEVHLNELFTGKFSVMFWMVQIFGMIIPIVVLLFKKGRKPLPLFIISVMVIIASWFKRFLIVTPTLLHPFIPIQNVPESWMFYNPTWEEWMITSATLAGALLLITFFVRILPIIPIWETAEVENENNLKINER
jgi:Ni/Fe-hydrogenase subunit HybB-like protein